MGGQEAGVEQVLEACKHLGAGCLGDFVVVRP